MCVLMLKFHWCVKSFAKKCADARARTKMHMPLALRNGDGDWWWRFTEFIENMNRKHDQKHPKTVTWNILEHMLGWFHLISSIFQYCSNDFDVILTNQSSQKGVESRLRRFAGLWQAGDGSGTCAQTTGMEGSRPLGGSSYGCSVVGFG